MFSLETVISDRDVKRIAAGLGGYSRRLPQQLAIIVNATAKKVRTKMSRDVRSEMAIKARDMNRMLSVRKAHKGRISAVVTLKHSFRPSLKAFSPRQTRKGVTYRISKKGSRKLAIGGFMGAKPGQLSVKLRGHVYKRVTKKRLPLTRLDGASAWASFNHNGMKPPTKLYARRELRKQIKRRANYLTLKRKGKI